MFGNSWNNPEPSRWCQHYPKTVVGTVFAQANDGLTELMSATQINPYELIDEDTQLLAIAATWQAIRAGESPVMAMLLNPQPAPADEQSATIAPWRPRWPWQRRATAA